MGVGVTLPFGSIKTGGLPSSPQLEAHKTASQITEPPPECPPPEPFPTDARDVPEPASWPQRFCVTPSCCVPAAPPAPGPRSQRPRLLPTRSPQRARAFSASVHIPPPGGRPSAVRGRLATSAPRCPVCFTQTKSFLSPQTPALCRLFTHVTPCTWRAGLAHSYSVSEVPLKNSLCSKLSYSYTMNP